MSVREQKVGGDEDRVLRLVNKVQMFQIAASKINQKQHSGEKIFSVSRGDGITSGRKTNFGELFLV